MKNNILIIHTDQHRYDCIGSYGNKEIQTPNIDAIAGDGTRYDNCYCSFPVCTPSRYSFLSGLYVHQHLGRTNYSTLPSGTDTFPRLLKNAGYKTKCIGKMHFRPTYLDVGFNEMILAEQQAGRYDDDYHQYLKSKGLADFEDLIDQEAEFRKYASSEYWDNFGASVSSLDEKDYSTTWIADRAVEDIDNWENNGNLLMVGFMKPHHPFDPPRPWCDMYNPENLSLLPGWTEQCLDVDTDRSEGYYRNEALDEISLKKVMSYYYALISQIDFHVGRIINRLKEKGLYDNTMIIYTSDHGEYMGYHHMLLKGNHLYEPVAKIPLIIKYPCGFDCQKTDESLISNVDMAATILEAAGIAPGEDMSKYSLLGNLRRGAVCSEDWDCVEFMVRSKNMKLIYYTNEPEKSMLFDLEKDPCELNNLYSDSRYKEDICFLKEKLLNWRIKEGKTALNYDEQANTITGAPTKNDGHFEMSVNYFADKMGSYING